MTRLEHLIEDWHKGRYGDDINIPITSKKLLEEVGELIEALLLGDQKKIFEEIGDVSIVLSCLAFTTEYKSMATCQAVALDKCVERERLKKDTG